MYRFACNTSYSIKHQFRSTQKLEMSLSAETEDQWAVSFPSLVNELLTPESHLATKYQYLHNNLLTRLECAFAERGDKPISQCTHTNFNGYEAGRCDTASFQESEDTTLLNKIDPIIDSDDPATRAELLCPHITNRMEIYGLAGTGSKLTLSYSIY